MCRAPTGGAGRVYRCKRQVVSPPSFGGLVPRKGGTAMVTYEELFAYSLVILGVVGLCYQIFKRK